MHLIFYLIETVQHFMMPLFRPFTGSLHEIQDNWRRRGTADWHLANGHVQSVKVSETRNHFWLVELSFYYVAGGEYWAGTTSRKFFIEADADEYAHQHARDSAVVVRYRPDKASKYVVLKQDQLSVSAVGAI